MPPYEFTAGDDVPGFCNDPVQAELLRRGVAYVRACRVCGCRMQAWSSVFVCVCCDGRTTDLYIPEEWL